MFSMIVAVDKETNGIGCNGKLLYSCPKDIKRFKDITIGHPVIMGRNTWDSLPDRFKPLPNRINIVLTRDKTFKVEGALVVHSVEEVLAMEKAFTAMGAEECFVIGGAEIYELLFKHCEKLYITEILPINTRVGRPIPDTFFSTTNGLMGWQLVELGTEKDIDAVLGDVELTFKTFSRLAKQD